MITTKQNTHNKVYRKGISVFYNNFSFYISYIIFVHDTPIETYVLLQV